jgi:hypothetical protein
VGAGFHCSWQLWARPREYFKARCEAPAYSRVIDRRAGIACLGSSKVEEGKPFAFLQTSFDHALARPLAVAVHAATRVGVDPTLYHRFGEAMRQQRLFAIVAHGTARKRRPRPADVGLSPVQRTQLKAVLAGGAQS